jgi:hypothetical protein
VHHHGVAVNESKGAQIVVKGGAGVHVNRWWVVSGE